MKPPYKQGVTATQKPTFTESLRNVTHRFDVGRQPSAVSSDAIEFLGRRIEVGRVEQGDQIDLPIGIDAIDSDPRVAENIADGNHTGEQHKVVAPSCDRLDLTRPQGTGLTPGIGAPFRKHAFLAGEDFAAASTSIVEHDVVGEAVSPLVMARRELSSDRRPGNPVRLVQRLVVHLSPSVVPPRLSPTQYGHAISVAGFTRTGQLAGLTSSSRPVFTS